MIRGSGDSLVIGGSIRIENIRSTSFRQPASCGVKKERKVALRLLEWQVLQTSSLTAALSLSNRPCCRESRLLWTVAQRTIFRAWSCSGWMRSFLRTGCARSFRFPFKSIHTFTGLSWQQQLHPIAQVVWRPIGAERITFSKPGNM